MEIKTPKIKEVKWAPSGPVSKAFMESTAFVRGLMGPIGSGKSVACVIEILRRAEAQAPDGDGVRRSRWCIIRNSYPELKSTTIKTWAEWCPMSYGKTNFDSPIIHHIKEETLDMEILFLALDRPEDVSKLLSLELTGAWINEAREVPKAIVDALTGRVGRFPPMKDGGATWSGVIMDTNPPDTEGWWYKMAEEDCPEGWEFFKQPSGRGPDAENIPNLPKNYYNKLVPGKDDDWIKVYADGEYGFLMEGQVVYPMFRDRTHVSKNKIEPSPGYALMIGVDFGMTPAAIIGQRLPGGKWYILDELVTEDYGTKAFAEELTSYIAEKYPGFDVSVACGDPSGDFRSPNSDDSCLDIMTLNTPWKWKPASTNDLSVRLEVVKNTLNRLSEGDPAFQLSPTCVTLRKGFAGSYFYKLIKGGDGTRTQTTPEKNSFSHPHDALQYLLLGGGEASIMLNKNHGSNSTERYKSSSRIQEQIKRVKNKQGYNGFKDKDWKPKGW